MIVVPLPLPLTHMIVVVFLLPHFLLLTLTGAHSGVVDSRSVALARSLPTRRPDCQSSSVIDLSNPSSSRNCFFLLPLASSLQRSDARPAMHRLMLDLFLHKLMLVRSIRDRGDGTIPVSYRPARSGSS